MYLKQSLFNAVAFLAFTATVSGYSIYPNDKDTSLLSFMSRSNNLLQQDPTRSLDCFNYYIPLINKLAEQYEVNYKACLNASDIDRANADNATLEERNDLANAAGASCALLSQCSEIGSVQGIFECYIDGGSANIRTMYDINANTSQQLANLREQYYLIENKENRCTNETKRLYEKDSAEAYANLNNCILGISEIPTETTESPKTTVATTTAAPTVEPTTPPTESTSTEAASTEEASTEKPSTEEPSTETPSTEEPSTEEPSTEKPSTDEPSTDGPTEEPNTDTPST